MYLIELSPFFAYLISAEKEIVIDSLKKKVL